jgi:hypothetical protein
MDSLGPIRLPHTGLRVPHDRYKVTSLREHNSHDGVAFVATLRYDGKPIGTIENGGTGGPTLFHPKMLRNDPGYHPETLLDLYAADARTEQGDPADLEAVLNDLVTEYDWPKRIAKADKLGRTIGRMMINDEHIGAYTVAMVELGRPYPALDLEQARTGLLNGKNWPGDDGWWQLWTGTAWVDATPRPATVPADLYL